MAWTQLRRGALALVIASTLSACGGGVGNGGANPPPPTQNPPPTNPPPTDPPPTDPPPTDPPPTDPPPASRTIGGTVTGLSGSGLVLQNNGGDNLAIVGAGPFTFATSVTQGNAYTVTVLTQPSNPQQTCVVSNGGGTAGNANVTSVAIDCTTDTFNVSATVSGLTGAGLIITNGSDRINVGANGSYTFDTAVASGAQYNVLVDRAPVDPIQGCTVANGNGTITNADVTVAITCAGPFPTLAFSLNQGDGTLGSFAIDAATGQMRPRFVAKTGAAPAQLATYKPANGNQFSYVSNQDSDSVSAFALDPRSGALVEVAGSPFATGGDRPSQLTLHPTGPFLYAINQNSGDIAAYTINAETGVLTPIAPVTTGTSTPAFAIDPTGSFAYVAASGTGELYTYAIDPTTGALSEVPGSRVTIGTSFGGMALERDGRFVYAFNFADGEILAFAIDATTGVPTEITGSPFAVGANIRLLATHPNGQFLYAKRGPQTETAANGVAVFAIDGATGSLSEITGSPFESGVANPIALAFDRTGSKMYAGHLLIVGTPEINVRAYSVNPTTGALTTISGSPFAAPAFPLSLDVDGSDKYLYVAGVQTNQVTAYSIDSGDGSLLQLPNSPSNVGFNPFVVATEQDTTPLSLSSKFIYVTDPAGSIRSFNFASNGMLSPGAGSPVSATAPLGITLDPRGGYAYVADPGAGGVRVYSVDAGTGALTAIPSGDVDTGDDPQYVAIDPSGRFAYVSIPSATTIQKYTIGATGLWSSLVTTPTADDVQDLVITPNGRFLMTASATGTVVSTYTINASTGELSGPLTRDTGGQISSLAVDVTGKFAYVTDSVDGMLRQYSINAQTGALSPVATVDYTLDAIAGAPKGIAVDPKGSFVFTADSTGNTVSIFSIGSGTGALTYIDSFPVGADPIAVTTDYSGGFISVATSGGELSTFRIDRDTPSLELVDTETTGATITEPATVVTSSHSE